MLDRLFTNCMIRPEDIPPSSDTMRVVGTFNPGAAAFGDGVVLLVRVVEQPVETRPGFVSSPRIDPDQGVVIDWLDENDYHTEDPRQITHKHTGEARLRFLSYLKVVHSADGRTADNFAGPVIVPHGPSEIYGIEDPRITRIGSIYSTLNRGIITTPICLHPNDRTYVQIYLYVFSNTSIVRRKYSYISTMKTGRKTMDVN